MKTLLSLIGLFVIICILITIRTQKSADQKNFLAGTFPSPLPDGQYKGSAEVTGSWVGKKFFATTQTGINLFRNKDGSTREQYPFKTYEGKGLRDSEISVFKIDYDVQANPFWVRPILDEMVEIAPGKYLGKIHYRFPYFPISIGYFRQEK